MIGLKRCISVVFAAAFCMPVGASATDVRIGYSEPLEALSYSRSSAEFQKPTNANVQKLGFNAFSRHFDIALTPNHTLLDAVGREALGPAMQIYRGSLAGSPDSWARIVIADGLPQGLVFDGTEMYAIESEGGEARIYRLADIHVEPGTLACGHAGMATSGAELLQTVIDETRPVVLAAQGATSEIDVAVVADFEFASDKGSNAEAAIITRMNNVDGIFSSQLGVQINVGRVDVFASSDDPFTDQTNASSLLDEVADFRFDSAAQRANGLTHLFTGRNLDGSTVGIAFGGALCRNRFGAGLTQATGSVTLDSLIVAHELGHNFGSPHDGTSDGNCESTPQTFLMAPSINGSDTFSSCSITQMQDDVSRASCITALASVDVAIVAGAQPASLFLGDSAALTFDVTSAGTEAANDVSVSVDIPAGLLLDSSSTTAGSCTDGAGSVDCTIGSLAAGAGATVTVFLTAETTGPRDVVATASATGDASAGNNTATTSFTVTAAVDLVASTPAATQLTINQSTTLRPSIENRASIAASNAAVTIAPSTGLRIDSASWPAGNCSLSGGEARCTTASLAANSTQTIEVQVTGTAEGQQTYTVTATADEDDRDTSNDSSSSQVNVTAATTSPGGGDDSGGGSAGFALLLLLSSVIVIRLRRLRAKVVASR